MARSGLGRVGQMTMAGNPTIASSLKAGMRDTTRLYTVQMAVRESPVMGRRI